MQNQPNFNTFFAKCFSMIIFLKYTVPFSLDITEMKNERYIISKNKFMMDANVTMEFYLVKREAVNGKVHMKLAAWKHIGDRCAGCTACEVSYMNSEVCTWSRCI